MALLTLKGPSVLLAVCRAVHSRRTISRGDGVAVLYVLSNALLVFIGTTVGRGMFIPSLPAMQISYSQNSNA